MALQILYQLDMQPDSDPESLSSFMRERLLFDEELIAFSASLVQGVQRNRTELDQQIGDLAEHWTIARMAPTDRNVLRIGAYELIYTQTPGRVVINEAVELARRFGAKQSGPFVNGLLDRVLKEKNS